MFTLAFVPSIDGQKYPYVQGNNSADELTFVPYWGVDNLTNGQHLFSLITGDGVSGPNQSQTENPFILDALMYVDAFSTALKTSKANQWPRRIATQWTTVLPPGHHETSARLSAGRSAASQV